MENFQSKIVILVGRSGSGKGTQGELIKKFLEKKFADKKTFYISTGAKFREFSQSGTYTANLSREINISGGLQPEFLAIWNWSRILIEQITEAGNIVFDGAPRKFHEAQVLHSAISFYDWSRPIVLEIDVDKEICLQRLLLRKRADDTEEVIRERLGWYERDVVPMLDWYKKDANYVYQKIEGNRSVVDIQKDILKFLEEQIK